MKMRILLLFLSFFLVLSDTVFAQELSGGGSSYSGGDVSSDNVPGPSDEVREGYEARCTASDKRQRLQRHDMCQTRFAEMGLPRSIDEGDIIQKFSCSKVEAPLREMALGCANYALSLVGDTLIGLGRVLGLGKYSAQVKDACGNMPQRRMSRPSASMPDGQRRYESLSPDERYQGEINSGALRVYSQCRERVIASIEARREREAANYRTSMQRTLAYCRDQSQMLASYIQRAARIRKGSRQDLLVRSCRLDALSALNIECSKCIEELSPETGDIEGSSAFRSMAETLRQYNPRAWSCFNAEKRGELVCAALTSAAGGAGAAVALAKVGRALGSSVANRAANAGKRLASEAENTTESVARAAASVSSSADEAVEAARAAAQGAGDSLETRTIFAESVLRREGLLDEGASLTERQAQAVWDAHRLSDDQIQQKALIMREGGVEQRHMRPLMEEGVAGGYQGANTQALRASFNASPTSPNSARILAESLEANPSLAGRPEVAKEISDLYKKEAENLERNFTSSAPGIIPRDPEDISRAYSTYASTLPNGPERQAAITKAAEYLKIYEESPTRRTELRRLQSNNPVSAGGVPTTISSAEVYASDFSQLVSQYRSAGSNQILREKLRAEMEAMSRFARENGWREASFSVPSN